MAAQTACALATAWLAKSSTVSKSVCGSSSIQGRRPNQEDRMTVDTSLPGNSGCGLYAVYDGHGGHRAASFAAEKMQGYVLRSKAFKGKDFLAALQQAFHDCETDFIQLAGREGLRDGTTALVALVQEEELTVAHVGDSRGVLCRKGGKTVAITQDHKPELEPEKKRIEALGGFVSYIGCWRAMGILAMSRAIGDLFLKPYVSAEPDVCAWPLDASDEFVVLASDGVFDVFDNEQVVRIARSAGSPQEAATLLTSSAFHAGSLDNVTAIVVALRGYAPRGIAAAASVAEPPIVGAAKREGGFARSLISAAWGSSGPSLAECSRAGDGGSMHAHVPPTAIVGVSDLRGAASVGCTSCTMSARPQLVARAGPNSVAAEAAASVPSAAAASFASSRGDTLNWSALWLDLVAH